MKNIELQQYDTSEVDFSIDKSLLSANSKVFLQYKKEPTDSAVCSLEITSNDSGNDWFPVVGYANIRWNVLPEHTLTNIKKITRFGYGLLLIDGTTRKTLSTGNLLMFPSYNSPWIVKDFTKRLEQETITATTDNQTTFTTINITLSDEMLVFVDSLLTTNYTKTSETTIVLGIGVTTGTRVTIFSIPKTYQELPINNTFFDMLNKAFFTATEGQTDFTVVGFELSDDAAVFADSVLVEYAKLDNYTIRLLAGVPAGTQVAILSPKTEGNTIIKPVENKQVTFDGGVSVYNVVSRQILHEIVTATSDGQTDFTITNFELIDSNIMVFVNFIVSQEYTISGDKVILNDGVPQGTVVIVYNLK